MAVADYSADSSLLPPSFLMSVIRSVTTGGCGSTPVPAVAATTDGMSFPTINIFID